MPSLPNKTFLFNYNARDYDQTTRTIPNHPDGTFTAQTFTLMHTSNSAYTNVSSAVTFNDDHISFSGGTYAQFSFTQPQQSPFNIKSTAKNLTVIVKMWRDPNAASTTPGTTSEQAEVIVNRGTRNRTFNYLIRCDATKAYFHSSTSNDEPGKYAEWHSKPVVLLYRVNNYMVEVKNLTDGTSNTPFSTSFNNETNRLTFFGQGYQDTASDVRNCIGGDFYWAYMSREVLTDEEVEQVVEYNGGSVTSPITTDVDSLNFKSSGGTKTITVSATDDWSVTTAGDWFSVSTWSGGTGDTVVTVTANTNTAATQNTGYIDFSTNNTFANVQVDMTQAAAGVEPYVVNVALGDKVPSAIYLGDTHLEACYLGDTLIFPLTATGVTIVSNVITDVSELEPGDKCLFYCPGHEVYVSDVQSRYAADYYYWSTFYPKSYTHEGAGYVYFEPYSDIDPLVGIVSAVTRTNNEMFVTFYNVGSYYASTYRFGPNTGGAQYVQWSGSFQLDSGGKLRITPGILVGKLKDSNTIQFGTETDSSSDDDYNYKRIVLRKIITKT